MAYLKYRHKWDDLWDKWQAVKIPDWIKYDPDSPVINMELFEWLDNCICQHNALDFEMEFMSVEKVEQLIKEHQKKYIPDF